MDGGGGGSTAFNNNDAKNKKLFTLIFIKIYFCSIMKIVIICDSFSFLRPYPSPKLLGQRKFAEALLECQKS